MILTLIFNTFLNVKTDSLYIFIPCTYDWIYSPLTRYSSKRLEGGDYRLNWKYVTFCKVQPKNVRDQNIEQISQIAWHIIWVRTSQCVLNQINFVISSCRVLEARIRMNSRHFLLQLQIFAYIWHKITHCFWDVLQSANKSGIGKQISPQ